MAKPYHKQPDDRVLDDLTRKPMGAQIRASLMEKNRVLALLTGDNDPLVPPVGAAPVDASYIVLSANGTLTNERVLSVASDTNVTLALSSSATTATITAGWASTLSIARGGTGASTALGAFNALSPLTTRGDLLTRDASNNIRLGVGATLSVLTANGTDPSWSTTPAVAQLGIGAAPSSSPLIHLDVTGSTRFVADSVSFGSSQTNFNIGNGTFLRLSATAAALVIRGFTNGIDGRVLIGVNAGVNGFTLKNETTATAANRLHILTGQDMDISVDDGFLAIYDGTLTRWRIIKWTSASAPEIVYGGWFFYSATKIDITQGGSLNMIGSSGSTNPYIRFSDNGSAGTMDLQTGAITGSLTMTLPALTDTIVTRTNTDNLSNKTFINLTTFDTSGANTGIARLKGDSAGTLPYLEFFNATGSASLKLIPAAIAGTVTITLPDATDTIVVRNATETLQNKTMQTNCKALGTDDVTGWSIADSTDNTKTFRIKQSGASTLVKTCIASINTASRIYTLMKDLAGNIPVVGDDPPAIAAGNLGKVDLTGQTADIGTTNLSNTPPAGFYEVEVILMSTTSAVGAGTLAVVIGWTDDVGATTSTVITGFSLTGTGRTTGRALLRVNSGDITYAVTITGIYSTAQYAVYVRVIALG